jgi:hypothetical protein
MTAVAAMLDPVGRLVPADVDDLGALLAHEHEASVAITLPVRRSLRTLAGESNECFNQDSV